MNNVDSLSLVSFVVLTTIVQILFLNKIVKIEGAKKWITSYILIIVIMSLSAAFGITNKFLIPLAPLFLVFNIIFAFLFSFSQFGSRLSDHLSVVFLLGLQSFRFPLELILHSWSDVGAIPETMTWTGQNIDIIAGVICMVLIPFYKKSIAFVWGAQIIGFGLLLNVIRVAILSSPFPFSWDLENPLVLVLYFPYVLIVPCLVTLALICHLLVFRMLLKRN